MKMCLIVVSLIAVTLGTAEIPQRIMLVVGFDAGGTSSIAARYIAESVGELSKIQAIVENKPGASGLLAAQWVQQQPPQSHSLLFMSSTSSFEVPPDLGLVPIGGVVTYTYVAVDRKGSPTTLEEYLQAAAHDDSFRSVAVPGAQSIPRFIGERLFERHGVKMIQVPYHGSAPAIQSVLGGQIPLAIVPYPDFVGFKGELQVIGMLDIGWNGVFASPGTSDVEVALLADVLEKASKAAARKLESVGFAQEWWSATRLQQVYERDHARWIAIADRLGVKP